MTSLLLFKRVHVDVASTILDIYGYVLSGNQRGVYQCEAVGVLYAFNSKISKLSLCQVVHSHLRIDDV